MSELFLVFPVIALTVIVLVGILSIFAKYVRARDQLMAGEGAAAAGPAKSTARVTTKLEDPRGVQRHSIAA